ILQGPDGGLYRIAFVIDDSNLVLVSQYNGATTPVGPVGASVQALSVGGYGTQGYLGNNSIGESTDSSAVNLYKFQVTSPGFINVSVSNLAAAFQGDLQLRLFDADGVELGSDLNSLMFLNSNIGATTYYVGVSAVGNAGYDPQAGNGYLPGQGYGSYFVNISTSSSTTAAYDSTSFATATSLGSLGAAGAVISGEIAPLGNLAYPALPGGPGTPGNRNLSSQGISGESNVGGTSGASVPSSIPVYYYNFQDVYGVVLDNEVHNQITDQQKNLARQIFTIYGHYLGIEFVETASSGLTVVTGDVRAVAPGISPTAVGGISGGGEVIMNGQLDYGSSPYGGSWFGIAFHEIGHALGLGHSYDAPSVMGSGVGGAGNGESAPIPGQPSIGSVEAVYPGDINLVPAENILPPDSTDIDIYNFQLDTAGTLNAEALAQRLTLPATASTDFYTNGFANVTFTAIPTQAAGTGISLTFQYADLGANSALPDVNVNGTQITVILNTNNSARTTVEGLVDAVNDDPLASKLVAAQITGGASADPGSFIIGNDGNLSFRLDLKAAADPSTLNAVLSLYSDATASATATTNFGTTGNKLATLNITAKAPGTAGNGVNIAFTKADLGKNVGPTVSVSGSTINVVLNTNAVGFTTANLVAAALNADVLAKNLVSASATGVGAGSTNISTTLGTSLTISTSGGQGSRTLIARNDNYLGLDSLINLHLSAGSYYIAVSSVGNTNFDPSIADSGFGGNTDGKYQLKLSFTADPAAGTQFVDAGINGSGGGVALSGDGVNTSGTAFNFWFNSSTGSIASGGNTIFVDKLNSADTNQDGSLSNPYSNISDALNAAVPGTILRIVGNGGADADPTTHEDSLSYQIGFDSQGNAAQDGATFVVPLGVTVMVDAGAVLKLGDAIINVGDTVPGIDRSNGSLQVLGTPGDNVIFTSLFDNSIGGNSDTLHQGGPTQGDWGGILYNQQSDFQGKDLYGNGIYLNSVNQATFLYGGGKVDVDSVEQVVNPIHISNPDGHAPFIARPAMWFNTISLSADSAISADPNSLANTGDRIGPDVYGNVIVDNSVNAFFIRVQTAPGQPTRQLDVPARITHTDIVYALTQNLYITGNPGGLYMPDPADPTHTDWSANVAGSLVIDPGVILKMSGSTIQLQVGTSQLIAEGTASQPIVITSINDNTFGAGGTFNTANNASTVGAPGDWGGIFFEANTTGSIDHAIIQYGGGSVGINGGFAHFNAIGIQQAQVRVAHTFFGYNDSGDASFDADPSRDGLLSNGPATIFVRGSQPILIDNQFLNNSGYIISINANALNNLIVNDWGDSVGSLNAENPGYLNYGPLVAGNTFTGNEVNGMEVRSESITTQTIWDDTGIVHVVTDAINDIINQHTFGGIRIVSNTQGSLVVKLQGANAGFFINGIPLDIIGRIGGALQIVGTSANPVILTSLKDDTVGAGFRLDGQPQNDTNGDSTFSVASPGDWNSITLMPYSNDTNVAVIQETGKPITTPATAQFMGTLAPTLTNNISVSPQGGNDYLPLGFDIHGALVRPSDVDVYSFSGTAGSEVWFQIGNSSPSLASVIELVDSNGKVLASANQSQATPNNPFGITSAPGVVALSILKDPVLGGVYYSSNPRDSMMRVILPGTVGTTSNYYIRVRSDQALTAGAYQLQVRLEQTWVTPGSTIQYSNISYATNGIQIEGLPANSVLTGTQQSTGTNNSFATAQNLGNLLATNNSTIDASGNLATPTSVDWYKFELQYDLIQAIAGVNAGGKTFSSIFQVFYTDGLTRPDTTLSVFDGTGKLILVSQDGGVTSTQPGPNQGNGLTDLTRGSVGSLDPFIGSAQLPAATPGSSAFTYYVAISSNAAIPAAQSAYFGTPSGRNLSYNGASNLTRLEPVDSVQRIVEDHIGFTGFTTGTAAVQNTLLPTTDAIFPIHSTASVSQNVVPFTLSDVTLFTVGNAGRNLGSADSFSGTNNYVMQNVLPNTIYTNNATIKMRSDGTLWDYYTTGNGANNQIGTLARIDPGTGAALQTLGPDNIPQLPASGTITVEMLNPGRVDAVAWGPYQINGDGITGSKYNLYYSVEGFGAGGYEASSRLYRANPLSGSAAVVTGEPWGVVGNITGANISGYTRGLEYVGNTLYGVSSNGQFYRISEFSGAATRIADFSAQFGGFTGLTLGPQNLLNVNGSNADGTTQQILFASTTSGAIVAFDTNGNLQKVFFNQNGVLTDPTTYATSSKGSVGQVTGITFSPLDFNLWHPTTLQSPDAGHGILSAPDNSRNTIFVTAVGSTSDSRASSERVGGASYYFGLENWVQIPQNGNDYIQYTDANGLLVNGQYGVQTNNNISGATFQQVLTSNNAQSGLGNNYNLPGGAHGSLITNSFDLSTYSTLDEPTLYYNYLLQTAGVSSLVAMQDSARVYGSIDGGNTWSELTTNNLILSTGGSKAELPRYITSKSSTNQSDPTSLSTVQPVFATNQWQQARVDLSEFAGANSVQLRFDFSTAGTMFQDTGNGNVSTGDTGESTGVGPRDLRAGQDNKYLGFAIDDIIVGFANRGEMVTGSASDTNYFAVPQDPNPSAPKQSLSGPYNFEIRQGTNNEILPSGISPTTVLYQQFFTTQREIGGFTLTSPDGTSINNGDSFTISDGVNQVQFVFAPAGTKLGTNQQLVAFTAGDSAAKVARSIRDAINAANSAKKFKVTAELSNGRITGATLTNGLPDTNFSVDLILATSVTTSTSFGQNNAGFINDYTTSGLRGDNMSDRPQGRISITNNTVSFSQQYGISVLPAPRDNDGNATPHPYSVLNLPTVASNRQIPGPNIVSNVINNFGVGGIQFSGDNTGGALAGVPYGRIVNNTIYGASKATGTGITVKSNAAPTILNNIIANTSLGISIDNTSTGTVVGTEVFQGNTVNGTTGTNAILLQPAAPLFVNPATASITAQSGAGFYLKEGSLAIDSSLNSLGERSTMTAVLSPLGIPQSPIIAPVNDRFGQLRIDDPYVVNATGLGQNIFIDRGAIERADFVGPSAGLTNPQDNGPADGDPTVNKVFIIQPLTLTEFDVQLSDVGVGIDNSTVKSSAFVLTQDGKTLVDGTDYKFVYNSTTHVVQFQSFTTFPTASNYTITIPLVKGTLPITDLAGNPIQANQSNGTVVFTIIGNHAPELTTFGPLPSAVQNFVDNITYAQLLGAAVPANLNIVTGHTPNFLITSIPNGTLQIKKTTQPGSPTFNVVPGTTVSANKSNLVEVGDVLLWNPGANPGTGVSAFTVLGYDPVNAKVAPALSVSTTPVPVKIDVINPTPILANTSLQLGVAPITVNPSFPVLFPISYSSLVTGFGVTWLKATGSDQQLQITTQSNSNGILFLNNKAQGANTTFKMGPSDTLAYEYVNTGVQTGNVLTITPAMTVKAYDGFNNTTYGQFQTSVNTGTLTMQVLDVGPPSFSPPNQTTATISPNQPWNVATQVTFAQLVAATGATIGYPGDELAFRLESLPASPTGALYINGQLVTAASFSQGPIYIRDASNFYAGDTVVWVGSTKYLPNSTPTPSLNSMFTVSAFDYTKQLDGFQNSLIKVNLQNYAPTLTSVNGALLGSAVQQTTFDITYQKLLGASNASDPNGDQVSFIITSIPAANGTLTITKSGSSTAIAVTAGVSIAQNKSNLVQPGDVLHWTGKPGISGNAVTAFSVLGYDGALSSTGSPVPVNLNVAPLGNSFDLSGSWLVTNSKGAAVGIGRIAQSGASLPTILNYNGIGTTGSYQSFNTVKAAKLDGVNNVVGTVDTSTADAGRISWSDGYKWVRISLGGTWAVTSGGVTTLGTVTQNNNVAIFTGPTGTLNTTISFNTTKASLQLQLPNSTTTPLVNDSFTAFGQTWKKLDLPPTYVSSSGGTAQVIQNAGNSLTFINGLGQSLPGYWLSPTQVLIPSTGITGTVGSGVITFSNGEVWTENVTLYGTKNGAAGTVKFAATPPTAVLPTLPVVTAFLANGASNEYVVTQGQTTALFYSDTGAAALGTLINNGTQATIADWGVTATFGTNKITFSAPVPGGSTIWNLAPLTSSPFALTNYLNATTAKTESVIQYGTNATFINDAGTWVQGTIVDTTVTAAGLGLGTGVLTDGVITWTGASTTTWVQSTLQTGVVSAAYFYNAANGQSEQIVFNGSYVIFVSDTGKAAFGTLNVAKTQATVTLNGIAYIATGDFTSSTAVGMVRFALASAPAKPVMTWVKTSALSPLITLTDTTGASFHVRITSSSTLVVIDGITGLAANTIGTRSTNKITWSNGAAAWNNFDINTLNALFQMSAGYP
ncbi:MAG: hypothetical protein JSS02_11200, partial [Planctomycetes bacterium]|nr:hypothetical protein [Planctomycetota bacterium]